MRSRGLALSLVLLLVLGWCIYSRQRGTAPTYSLVFVSQPVGPERQQYVSGAPRPDGRVPLFIPDDLDVTDLTTGGATVIRLGDLQAAHASSQWSIQNTHAAETHRVPQLASLLNVSGSGVTVAVVDGGYVSANHPEFQVSEDDTRSRVIRVGPAGVDDDHATLIAGTVAALGLRNRNVRGMAPGAHVRSHRVRDGDPRAWLRQSQISNHAFTRVTGWDGAHQWAGPAGSREDPRFGQYDELASALDGAVAEVPAHLAVVAAGNDRGDGPPLGESHWDRPSGGGVQFCTDEHAPDGRKGGFDTVHGACLAKNVMCVGAIRDRREAGPARITSFSSWGPADDGRIKPEVVANGEGLESTRTNSRYGPSDGTSQAAPVVAGIAALLAEHLRKSVGPAELGLRLKALLIHTAEDAGAPGPDPAFGWGVVDGASAARFLLDRRQNAFIAARIQPGEVRDLHLAGAGPVRATITWVDPPADVRSGTDDPTPSLINDVDLELYPPAVGTPYLPYLLHADSSQPALRARNERDNVEVIDAPAASGTWTLRVIGRRITTPDQQVVIAVSGLRAP